MAQRARKIRILAFGDSLTQGHTNNLTSFHPYTHRLGELLENEGCFQAGFDLDNVGITGEFVRSEMTSRLPQILQKQGPYDLVIILGGTNDLNELKKGEEKALFEEIISLHDNARKHGAKTLFLTMPETDLYFKDMGKNGTSYVKEEGEQGRIIINEMLREFAKNREDVFLCDIAVEMPQASLTEEELEKYWDDGLHYTEDGYDKMGEIIFEKVRLITWE